ncbi:MAG: acyl carrier protein [Eubacterium sp.]|nr:acyl carrier protein [Eubacterium sp.]
MSTEEKIELLEEIFEMDEGELDLDANLDDVEEWDSLSKLALMAEVRTRMGVALSVENVKSFKTVQDIVDFLK